MKSRTAAVAGVVSLVATFGLTPTVASAYSADISAHALRGVPKIEQSSIDRQLKTLESITRQNGGHRAPGSPAELATRDYIIDTMRGAGYRVRVQPCDPSACVGVNILADTEGGNPNKTYIFGAHIDSVATTPGMNDNASGVAAILEIALALAERNPTLTSRVRFAFWADEEAYLRGSKYYVDTLGAEKSTIAGYINAEMIGSPNGGYFINNLGTPLGRVMKNYYDSEGVEVEENIELAERSDNLYFEYAGIPATGVAAGAGDRKTAAQARKWGGKAGVSYDSCYHRACDTFQNINSTIINRAVNAQLSALYQMAVAR